MAPHDDGSGPAGPAGPAEVNRRILPPALETLTAWTMACEEDPRFFHDAMQRVLADALGSQDPQRGLAELMFGMTSLSGILLEELAASSGRSPSELLGELNARYLDNRAT